MAPTTRSTVHKDRYPFHNKYRYPSSRRRTSCCPEFRRQSRTRTSMELSSALSILPTITDVLSHSQNGWNGGGICGSQSPTTSTTTTTTIAMGFVSLCSCPSQRYLSISERIQLAGNDWMVAHPKTILSIAKNGSLSRTGTLCGRSQFVRSHGQ